MTAHALGQLSYNKYNTSCGHMQAENENRPAFEFLFIWVFILLVLILDWFFVRSMSQMKAYNVINPRKIAIQRLNVFFTVKSAQTRAIYV